MENVNVVIQLRLDRQGVTGFKAGWMLFLMAFQLKSKQWWCWLIKEANSPMLPFQLAGH